MIKKGLDKPIEGVETFSNSFVTRHYPRASSMVAREKERSLEGLWDGRIETDLCIGGKGRSHQVTS